MIIIFIVGDNREAYGLFSKRIVQLILFSIFFIFIIVHTEYVFIIARIRENGSSILHCLVIIPLAWHFFRFDDDVNGGF